MSVYFNRFPALNLLGENNHLVIFNYFYKYKCQVVEMQEYLVYYFQLFPAAMNFLKQALDSFVREDDESFAALGLGVVNLRTSLNGFFRNNF